MSNELDVNNINNLWDYYIDNNIINDDILYNNVLNNDRPINNTTKPSDIYISTKTKISYLNQEIDLLKYFWELKLIPYHLQKEGFIKKQIKYIFTCENEYNNFEKYIQTVDNVNINFIRKNRTSDAYKKIIKLSIGLSNKDINQIKKNQKSKSAFYNCFVLLMRIKDNEDNFKRSTC